MDLELYALAKTETPLHVHVETMTNTQREKKRGGRRKVLAARREEWQGRRRGSIGGYWMGAVEKSC